MVRDKCYREKDRKIFQLMATLHAIFISIEQFTLHRGLSFKTVKSVFVAVDVVWACVVRAGRT